MNCICYRSPHINMYPLGPLGCVTCGCCGLVVSIGPQKVNTHPGSERHYRQVDPHGKVADAKRFFFEEALAQMEALAGSGGKRLLDVGCGYGYFLEVARRRPKCFTSWTAGRTKRRFSFARLSWKSLPEFLRPLLVKEEAVGS